MGEKTVPTNLRLPASLDDQVREYAARMGVPRNTAIKIILTEVVTAATTTGVLGFLLSPEGREVLERLQRMMEGRQP